MVVKELFSQHTSRYNKQVLKDFEVPDIFFNSSMKSKNHSFFGVFFTRFSCEQRNLAFKISFLLQKNRNFLKIRFHMKIMQIRLLRTKKMLHMVDSAPLDSQSLPVSKKMKKIPMACFVSLYPGGEIPGAEEEVQAAASGERSQASQDGRGGTETSQPGQDCCCCAVGCGSRSDPLPSAGRAHVMCCSRGKLANSHFLCKQEKTTTTNKL